jgi:hypothetical protein
MIKNFWRPAVPALLLVAAAAAAPEGTIEYWVTGVEGKLFRETPRGEERLAAGAELRSGETVATGRRSSADLTAPEFGSLFHLGSRTRVVLAADTPGVLLRLEKGRLRALFEELVGRPETERRIETPSAILAVRGTEYGVEVGGSGHTTLVVFSGVVEVFDRARRGAPVRVEAGYTVRVRRGRAPGAPRPHDLTQRSWDRGAMPGARGMSPGTGSAGSPGATGAGQGRRGGGGSRRHGG